MYDEDYDLKINKFVIVTKKKRTSFKITKSRSTSKVIAIKKLFNLNKNVNLFTLLRVQGKYFVKCIEIYEFEVELYVIFKHMLISLI